MKKPLRIIVQENDNDFRKQFAEDLKHNRGFELVKSHKSFLALTHQSDCFAADVVLVNWQYPPQNLFDFIQTSQKNNALLRVLVTFDFVQPDFIAACLLAGANGWLLKPFAGDDVVHYIQHQYQFPKLMHHVNKLAHSAF